MLLEFVKEMRKLRMDLPGEVRPGGAEKIVAGLEVEKIRETVRTT